MVILGYNTQADAPFTVTATTKRFYLASFGFIPHQQSEQIVEFLTNQLNNLEIKAYKDFNQSQTGFLKVYEIFDRRTWDVGIVFNQSFGSAIQAMTWWQQQVQQSPLVSDQTFCEVECIDADLFDQLVMEIIQTKAHKKNQAKKQKQMNQIVQQRLNVFYQGLQQEFINDPEMLKTINQIQQKTN